MWIGLAGGAAIGSLLVVGFIVWFFNRDKYYTFGAELPTPTQVYIQWRWPALVLPLLLLASAVVAVWYLRKKNHSAR
jgi:hypothetical protein